MTTPIQSLYLKDGMIFSADAGGGVPTGARLLPALPLATNTASGGGYTFFTVDSSGALYVGTQDDAGPSSQAGEVVKYVDGSWNTVDQTYSNSTSALTFWQGKLTVGGLTNQTLHDASGISLDSRYNGFLTFVIKYNGRVYACDQLRGLVFDLSGDRLVQLAALPVNNSNLQLQCVGTSLFAIYTSGVFQPYYYDLMSKQFLPVSDLSGAIALAYSGSSYLAYYFDESLNSHLVRFATPGGAKTDSLEPTIVPVPGPTPKFYQDNQSALYLIFLSPYSTGQIYNITTPVQPLTYLDLSSMIVYAAQVSQGGVYVAVADVCNLNPAILLLDGSSTPIVLGDISDQAVGFLDAPLGLVFWTNGYYQMSQPSVGYINNVMVTYTIDGRIQNPFNVPTYPANINSVGYLAIPVPGILLSLAENAGLFNGDGSSYPTMITDIDNSTGANITTVTDAIYVSTVDNLYRIDANGITQVAANAVGPIVYNLDPIYITFSGDHRGTVSQDNGSGLIQLGQTLPAEVYGLSAVNSLLAISGNSLYRWNDISWNVIYSLQLQANVKLTDVRDLSFGIAVLNSNNNLYYLDQSGNPLGAAPLPGLAPQGKPLVSLTAAALGNSTFASLETSGVLAQPWLTTQPATVIYNNRYVGLPDGNIYDISSQSNLFGAVDQGWGPVTAIVDISGRILVSVAGYSGDQLYPSTPGIYDQNQVLLTPEDNSFTSVFYIFNGSLFMLGNNVGGLQQYDYGNNWFTAIPESISNLPINEDGVGFAASSDTLYAAFMTTGVYTYKLGDMSSNLLPFSIDPGLQLTSIVYDASGLFVGTAAGLYVKRETDLSLNLIPSTVTTSIYSLAVFNSSIFAIWTDTSSNLFVGQAGMSGLTPLLDISNASVGMLSSIASTANQACKLISANGMLYAFLYYNYDKLAIYQTSGTVFTPYLSPYSTQVNNYGIYHNLPVALGQFYGTYIYSYTDGSSTPMKISTLLRGTVGGLLDASGGPIVFIEEESALYQWTDSWRPFVTGLTISPRLPRYDMINSAHTMVPLPSNCCTRRWATYNAYLASIPLPAPMIDWNNTNFINSTSITLSWFPVAGADSYKVFVRKNQSVNAFINNPIIQHKMSTGFTNFFDNDFPPTSTTSMVVPLVQGSTFYGYKNNFFVFSYRNRVRGDYPVEQVLATLGPSQQLLELWPAITTMYDISGGVTYTTFINRLTGESIRLDEASPEADPPTNYPNLVQISNATYLKQKNL